ncbi:3D domain-containing protein [Hoeflea prorocentri]|uniref:3D domain-containing protein n=1 Tax=Hoeflea prorocentri TaxID=1922333 RepID=A0A9X3UMV6_9HYPH|nr:3D domain-containing protein [Hoeflea prorocentri]MCY6381981.1 3D domain-containing protein [Hoeflea prorocentri]MDA5399781.1 3D domain-containing protein [Hoeflea prorocentri]
MQLKSVLGAFVLVFCFLPAVGLAADDPLTFTYDPPKDLSKHREIELWGTFYHTRIAKDQPDGHDLLNKHDKPIGPKLGRTDWCKAALEGAAVIEMKDGSKVIVNVRDADGPAQVNCSPLYPHLSARARNGMRHTRFFKITSPKVKYGYGIDDMPLAAFRTIAVDRHQVPIRYRSLVFIPKLKGRNLTLADGTAITHDGYVFAADTGSGVHGHHIDFYTGFVNTNPFPDLAGGERHRFKAYLVTDEAIHKQMLELHSD